MIVKTTRLLRRCQLGKQSKDPLVQDAAVSCMSFLVLFLWEQVVSLPVYLEPSYNRLPDEDTE